MVGQRYFLLFAVLATAAMGQKAVPAGGERASKGAAQKAAPVVKRNEARRASKPCRAAPLLTARLHEAVELLAVARAAQFAKEIGKGALFLGKLAPLGFEALECRALIFLESLIGTARA